MATQLIREKGTDAVYAKEDGEFTHIPDPQTFESKGYNWENVEDVSTEEFQSMTGKQTPQDQQPISADKQDVPLFREQGGEDVFARTEKGMREVKNPEAMESAGLSFDEVTEVSGGTLEQFRERFGEGPGITEQTQFREDITAPTTTGEGATVYDEQAGVGEMETPPAGEVEATDASDASFELDLKTDRYGGAQQLLKQYTQKVRQKGAAETEERQELEQMQQAYQELPEADFMQRYRDVLEQQTETEQGDVIEQRNEQLMKVTNLKQRKREIEAEKQNRLQQLSNMKGEAAAKQAAIADAKAEYNRKINRVSAQIGSEAVLYEALNGQVEEAKNTAKMAAQARVDDLERKRRQLEFMYETQRAQVNEMNEEKRMWLEQTLNEARNLEEMKRKDAQTKLEWAAQYPTLFQGRDVLEMDINQAAQLAGQGARRQRLQEEREELGGGTAGDFFTDTQLAKGVTAYEKDTGQDITLNEFRNFSTDKANEYIYGEKSVGQKDWKNAETMITGNIQRGNTSSQKIASINLELQRRYNLTLAEAEALMNKYGMVRYGGNWTFNSSQTPEGFQMSTTTGATAGSTGATGGTSGNGGNNFLNNISNWWEKNF